MNLTDNLYAGKLVRFCAPRAEDPDIMAKWSDNVEYSRMLEFRPVQPRSADYWAVDKDHKENPRSFNFRLRTLEDDKLIGFLNLWVSWVNQTCWLAIGIGDSAYWSHGYGSDALRLGINYGFRELGLYKVGLGVFSYNTRAFRAYEKAGFVTEARQRQMLYKDGQYYDMIEMSILRPEWEARLKEQDSQLHEPN